MYCLRTVLRCYVCLSFCPTLSYCVSVRVLRALQSFLFFTDCDMAEAARQKGGDPFGSFLDTEFGVSVLPRLCVCVCVCVYVCMYACEYVQMKISAVMEPRAYVSCVQVTEPVVFQRTRDFDFRAHCEHAMVRDDPEKPCTECEW